MKTGIPLMYMEKITKMGSYNIVYLLFSNNLDRPTLLLKRIVMVFIMFVAHTAAGNAQFFVEGSVGMSFHGGSSDSVEMKPGTYNSFTVSPLVGYRLNDRFAAGISVSLSGINEEYLLFPGNPDSQIEVSRKSFSWKFAVFGRYKLLGMKKLSVLVESSAYIGRLNTVRKSESTTTNQSTSSIDIKMLPLVSCDLSDKFSLIAACEFLSLELSSETENRKDAGFKIKRNHFGFNTQSQNS